MAIKYVVSFERTHFILPVTDTTFIECRLNRVYGAKKHTILFSVNTKETVQFLTIAIPLQPSRVLCISVNILITKLGFTRVRQFPSVLRCKFIHVSSEEAQSIACLRVPNSQEARASVPRRFRRPDV
jgi:hypothetical protein